MSRRPWTDYGAVGRVVSKLAAATAVRPPARFGGLVFEGDHIAEFTEKPQVGEGQPMAYRHGEFWQCMDTLRDLRLLEGLWSSGQAPWRVRES